MVLPLIPLAIIGVGAVSGVGGTALGFKGGFDIKKASKSVRQAVEQYEAERSVMEELETKTNAAVLELGERQERAIRLVVERFAEFLRRNEKQVSESEKLLLDGLEASSGRVAIGRDLDQDSMAWIGGMFSTAAVGMAINSGVPAAVTALASASTGTAISTLSGVAASNATLAALGGGSLAAGGGGMAAGALALNFVTIGPAILVSGFMVAGQGTKAKSKARVNQAEVAEAIAKMKRTRVEFDAIVSRSVEMRSILDDLVDRAVSALDALEEQQFDPELHAGPFQLALVTTLAVRDVASAGLVDEDGQLSEGTAAFVVKHKAWVKEPES
ncbi:hypothetical protein [Dietzia psychralcaliphila]|uniref:hypothetical protein n=1 Tax=Dietzia psychralcaliphila TaxID=139021 RepID=UPI001C1DD2FD|nr:hypothetical protein [Dietzia psychralcaliphila]